ncbi:hypothetical protein IKA92_00025 [bacterium]|nr:hypothetical protein [bacterium]
MAKIKVSADTVLAILQGIMNDPAINYTIEDISAPSEWQGKKVQDALGVEYYTFRHRPVDTEVIVQELISQGKDYDTLEALKRSFCILSLGHIERVFSKKNDIITIPINLEYWVQSEKVKLLEDMFEDMSIETIGERIAIQIGAEVRDAVIALGGLSVSEIQEMAEYGEMAICEMDIDIILYPQASSISAYKVEAAMVGDKGEVWVEIPVSSVAIATTMTQKAVPFVNRPRDVGNINLSRVKTVVLTFDGYKNEFINYITDYSLSTDKEIDNNKVIRLKITRDAKSYEYSLVVKDHTITVKEEVGNEVHSLTLTKEGKGNGTS